MNCSKLTDVLIVNWLPILLQVVIFWKSIVSCFNYVADFPCCNELHRYCFCFLFSQSFKELFLRASALQNLLMPWSWTIPAAFNRYILTVIILRTFRYFFLIPSFLTECKGIGLIPNCKIVFKNTFSHPDPQFKTTPFLRTLTPPFFFLGVQR